MILFSLFFIIFIFIIYKFISIKEHFFISTNLKQSSKPFNKIHIDLFHSVFNSYNPYITNNSTIKNILSSKCYVKYLNNFLLYDEKPWLRTLSYGNIIKNINNIGILFNINNIDDTYNIQMLQQKYINNFVNMAYLYSKNNNPRYFYYNDIIKKYTFYDVSIIINYIINALNNKSNDDSHWIEIVLSIFINNNIIYFMDNFNISPTDDKYNTILVFATYILSELITYNKSIFSRTVTNKIESEGSIINQMINSENRSFYGEVERDNINITIESSLYEIKNRVFYNDDGKYFINNIIFDCKI